MRLPFFSPDPRLLVDAQWALVRAVEQAVDRNSVLAGLQARRMVAELLEAVHNRARTPEEWANILSWRLLVVATETLNDRQTLAAQRDQLAELQARIDQLQGQAAHIQSLVALVREREAELAKAQADATRLRQRVRELETALAGQAKSHEAEIARLQGEIVSLNRIVGSQQRKLNDLLAPEG
ncbi:MAG: ATG16 family protein [Anaerolineae bacterium]|nr:ATG16 family protein [Anaerolineae bacterium]